MINGEHFFLHFYWVYTVVQNVLYSSFIAFIQGAYKRTAQQSSWMVKESELIHLLSENNHGKIYQFWYITVLLPFFIINFIFVLCIIPFDTNPCNVHTILQFVSKIPWSSCPSQDGVWCGYSSNMFDTIIYDIVLGMIILPYAPPRTMFTMCITYVYLHTFKVWLPNVYW